MAQKSSGYRTFAPVGVQCLSSCVLWWPTWTTPRALNDSTAILIRDQMFPWIVGNMCSLSSRAVSNERICRCLRKLGICASMVRSANVW